MARMVRPSSPKLAWPSPGWMLSRAARSCASSLMGCVSNSIWPPRAMICAFSALRLCGERGERLLLGVGKSRAGAHAEGVVENDQKQAAVGVCGGAAHKGIGEGQHYKQNKRRAQREEQQIFADGDAGWSFACRVQRTSAS